MKRIKSLFDWLEKEIDIQFVISVSLHKEMDPQSWMNFHELFLLNSVP